MSAEKEIPKPHVEYLKDGRIGAKGQTLNELPSGYGNGSARMARRCVPGHSKMVSR